MLVVDKGKREHIGMVRRKLQDMFNECRKDQKYALPRIQTEECLRDRDETQPQGSYWRELRCMRCF